MQLPRWLDGRQDAGEAKFTHTVLVPVLLGIVATALGVGAAKACCGANYRKFDPHNLLPLSMAGVTSLMAVWSYFNPPPPEPDLWEEPPKSAGRRSRWLSTK